jgi:hypothetical protein
MILRVKFTNFGLKFILSRHRLDSASEPAFYNSLAPRTVEFGHPFFWGSAGFVLAFADDPMGAVAKVGPAIRGPTRPLEAPARQKGLRPNKSSQNPELDRLFPCFKVPLCRAP